MVTIESTIDYSVFKIHPRNRKIDNMNLRKLEESVKANNTLDSHPILVDKDFYIIDGQHRLKIAQKLSVPIYYISSKHLCYDDMIRLNNNQKAWNISDYLNYYAVSESPEYIKLNDFLRKTNIQINIAIQLLNGTRALSFFKDFREGKYKFPSNDELVEAENKNIMIKDVIQFIKKKTSGNKIYLDRVTFYGALVDFFNCKSVSFEVFKKKLHFKLDLLRHCTKQCQYVQIFKEIYNWKNQSPVCDSDFIETNE